MKTLTGTIHGNTIELNGNPGLPEGEMVEVSVRAVSRPAARGDGLLRCAGILSADWSPADDAILREIQQARQLI